MSKVRYGVVGVNGMGRGHCRTITQATDRSFRLAAVADIEPDLARAAGEEFGVPWFDGAQAMYDSGLVDAVIIATPHYWHVPLGIRAARAGLHVLSEKPLSSSVGAARTLVAECRKRKVTLGAMLQMRTRGIMMKMHQMIAAGRLGEVFRVSMVCSNWYRTQFYYESGAWRGTWDGEGGGVLLNQAPHSLDLFYWMGGLPKRVIATVSTRLHKIEVENTANVICDYGNGKTGGIYATTAEAPGTEQLLVAGDKGTLIAEGGKLRFAKCSKPISQHIMNTPIMFTNLPCTWQDVEITKDPGGGHLNVIRAFAKHLQRGTSLIADGAEAVNELELSNAIYLSGFTGKPVDLPVAAADIERMLARLERERSTGRGGGMRAKAAREMTRLVGAGWKKAKPVRK